MIIGFKLSSLYWGGSESESDEILEQSALLKRMGWRKNACIGVKIVEHLYENVFMHREEKYT